ncbi:hypothetical protein M2140_001929 [Clostridiales Family XIII bacterium PM5-7]
MAVSIDITITQNSQNKTNNTSNVTVKVAAKWTYGSYNLSKCSGSCTIDGTKYTFSSAFNTGQTTSGSATIYSKTLNISHASNGKKTLSCSASYVSGVSSGTVTDSASKTLTAIPIDTEEPSSNILQSVSTTDTSLTWYLYNFSALQENSRRFRFTLYNSSGGVVSEGTVYRSAGTTDVSYTFTGLEPGTSYRLETKMNGVTPAGVNVDNIHTYTNSGATKEEATTLSLLTSATAESIWTYAYGINKSSIDRKISFTANGKEFFSSTLLAGTTPSAQYAYYYDIEEGESYDIKVTLTNSFAGLFLASKSETVDIPWDKAMSIGTINVGETTITVQAYGLNGNKDYARTLKWYVKGPKDTSYVQESTTQVNANTSNTSFTFPKSNLRANTMYEFKVDLVKDGEVLNSLTTSANTLQVSGTLEVENIADTSVTLYLSGMKGSIGRTIKWYYKRAVDSEYILSGETTMTSSASSVAKVVTGLVNETAYNFKAEIYDTADTGYIIGLKTGTATTQKQIAIMSLAKATSVSLRVNLSDMETNVNYDKHIYWYIRRSTDATFTLAGVDIVSGSDDISTISRLFTGLISSTINKDGTLSEALYNVRAVIKKNDATTMATITNTYMTSLRDSDIPTPSIVEVLQVIGEKNAEMWWEAPEHIESSEAYVHYEIEISTDGINFTQVDILDAPPAEYTLVAFDTFDTDYYLRVKAYPVIASEDTKYSNVVRVRMSEYFDWETVSKDAECIVRADKWNLIVRYIKKRLNDKGIETSFEFTQAKRGKDITAVMFNQLVNSCNAFYITGVDLQLQGNAVKAEDLLALQTAVNDKEE